MNSEINVTSLIDLAFTLLTLFIITAPVLQGGLAVTPPEAQVRPVTSQDTPFIITVNEAGAIFIAETRVSAEEFDEVFPGLFASADPASIYIRGDRDALWGAIFGVMGTVYAAAAETGATVSMVGVDPPRNR
jgi:biopolymer transport protein ExbD